MDPVIGVLLTIGIITLAVVVPMWVLPDKVMSKYYAENPYQYRYAYNNGTGFTVICRAKEELTEEQIQNWQDMLGVKVERMN